MTTTAANGDGPCLCALACGTMSRAIMSGVLDAVNDTGVSKPELPVPTRFVACVKRRESANRIREQYGSRMQVFVGDNAAGVREADYILLGCKPYMARTILSDPAVREGLENKVLFSVCAGLTLAQLREMVPASTRLLRVMPNTPCKIRQGMSVVCADDSVHEEETALVCWMFSQIGRSMLLEEKHFNAATALCGSGPAFTAVLLEAMTDGGVMMGLPRAEAQTLVSQSAARMALAGEDPYQIRSAVTTPGGCTIGGLLVMEDGKIRSTLARSIEAATNIAAGLGNK